MYNKIFFRKIFCLSRLTHKILNHGSDDKLIGSGQFSFLMFLFRHGDGKSQYQISQNLNLNKTTTTRTLKKLEDKGYIRKEQDNEDKRIFRIYLTEKAYSVEEKLKEYSDSVYTQITKDISEKDLEIFMKVTDQIINNIKIYDKTEDF